MHWPTLGLHACYQESGELLTRSRNRGSFSHLFRSDADCCVHVQDPGPTVPLDPPSHPPLSLHREETPTGAPLGLTANVLTSIEAKVRFAFDRRFRLSQSSDWSLLVARFCIDCDGEGGRKPTGRFGGRFQGPPGARWEIWEETKRTRKRTDGRREEVVLRADAKRTHVPSVPSGGLDRGRFLEGTEERIRAK